MLQLKKLLPYNKAQHAFQITPKIKDDNQYVVTVAPGTINNIIPNNLLDKEKLKEFNFSKNEITYVKASCKANNRSIINTVSIDVNSTKLTTQTPVSFGTPNEFEVLLGIVYNMQVYQTVNSNLFFSSRVAYIESKAPEGPGQVPFTAYLIWST
jgi:hypothetical protein